MRFDISVKVFIRHVAVQHSFISRSFQLKQSNDFISNFTFLIGVTACFEQTVCGWSNSYNNANLSISKEICRSAINVSRHQMQILPPELL